MDARYISRINASVVLFNFTVFYNEAIYALVFLTAHLCLLHQYQYLFLLCLPLIVFWVFLLFNFFVCFIILLCAFFVLQLIQHFHILLVQSLETSSLFVLQCLEVKCWASLLLCNRLNLHHLLVCNQHQSLTPLHQLPNDCCSSFFFCWSFSHTIFPFIKLLTLS